MRYGDIRSLNVVVVFCYLTQGAKKWHRNERRCKKYQDLSEPRQAAEFLCYLFQTPVRGSSPCCTAYIPVRQATRLMSPTWNRLWIRNSVPIAYSHPQNVLPSSTYSFSELMYSCICAYSRLHCTHRHPKYPPPFWLHTHVCSRYSCLQCAWVGQS